MFDFWNFLSARLESNASFCVKKNWFCCLRESPFLKLLYFFFLSNWFCVKRNNHCCLKIYLSKKNVNKLDKVVQLRECLILIWLTIMWVVVFFLFFVLFFSKHISFFFLKFKLVEPVKRKGCWKISFCKRLSWENITKSEKIKFWGF